MNKVAVLYVFHQMNERVHHFFNKCIFKDPLVDFIIISNGKNNGFNREMVPDYVKVLIRNNVGYDFAGWSHALFYKEKIDNTSNIQDFLYKKYKHFIFVNSSVIGPILPLYIRKKWTDIFINELEYQNSYNNVKILGPTINSSGGRGVQGGIIGPPSDFAHVQSYVFCITIDTLEYLIQSKIFENKNENQIIMDNNSFTDVIVNKEIKMSRVIIQNGWNIGSLLKIYNNVDFTFKTKSVEQYKNEGVKFHGDIMYESYINALWNIYDVIFIKANRIPNILRYK